MTLQDLGNIGEFVGAVGVIASLVYLAVQIRQNTRSVRAAMVQSSTSDALAVLLNVARPEVAGSLQNVIANDASAADQMVYRFQLWALVRSLEALYSHYRNGLIPESHYRSRMASLKRPLANPIGQSLWVTELQATVDPDFVGEVNRLIDGAA